MSTSYHAPFPPFVCRGPRMLEDFTLALKGFHALLGTTSELEKEDLERLWFLVKLLVDALDATDAVIGQEYSQLLTERKQRGGAV